MTSSLLRTRKRVRLGCSRSFRSLLFDGDPTLEVANISPWMDLRVPPKEVKLAMVEAQQHRRFLKTHLPVDALKFSPKAKYIYIGRDGRDVVWSLYNHHANANQLWYDALNNAPGRVGPPIERPPADIRQYWHDWLSQDGYPFWSFWENVSSWWAIRTLPNVMLVHFDELKRDLPTTIRRIAYFAEIPIDETHWQDILLHCSFDWMKANATKSVPLGGAFWDRGAEVFINKGINGRWKDTLTARRNRGIRSTGSIQTWTRMRSVAGEVVCTSVKEWSRRTDGKEERSVQRS